MFQVNIQQINYDNYVQKLAATGNSYDVEMERKEWNEFRQTGLLWFINSIFKSFS